MPGIELLATGGGGGGTSGLPVTHETATATTPAGSALITCDSTSGAFTLTLATLSSTATAEQVVLLTAGANIVTIAGEIDGATAPGILTAIGDRYRFLWDGAAGTWWTAEASLAPWLITTSLTWPTPAGVHQVRATLKGGGGGGGGAGSMNSVTNATPGVASQAAGGGGGCGGLQDQVIPVTPGNGAAIVIGAGGNGGTGGAAAASGGTGNPGTAGSAGGATTGFGLTAPGGGPGGPSLAQSGNIGVGGSPGDPNNYVPNPEPDKGAYAGWGNAAYGAAGTGLPGQNLYGGGANFNLATLSLGGSGGSGVLLNNPPLFNGGLYVYRGNPIYSTQSSTANGVPGQAATQYGCGGGGGGGGAPGGAGGAGGAGGSGQVTLTMVA